MTWTTVHPLLLNLVRAQHTRGFSVPPPEDEAWDTITGQAEQHGLISVLYRWLNDSGWALRLPPRILDRITTRVFLQAAWNLQLAAELTSILQAFETGHLACVPIRGLALAEFLYGDMTARPIGDVDLLVRKEEIPAVSETLQALGFKEIDRRPGFARTFSYTLEFYKDHNGWIIVEPHWTIAYPPFADKVDMEQVWKRCVKGWAIGVETCLLGRSDLFTHLCFHIIHKRTEVPLLWFYELDRLIRQDEASLDWSQIVRVAQGTGQGGLFAEVFAKLKECFNARIPDHVLTQLKAQRLARREQAATQLVSLNIDGRESLALFLTLRGFRTKLRYALSLLFPSPGFMVIHYGLSGRWDLGCSYLTRVAHFSWEGFKGLVGLLAGSWIQRSSWLNR